MSNNNNETNNAMDASGAVGGKFSCMIYMPISSVPRNQPISDSSLQPRVLLVVPHRKWADHLTKKVWWASNSPRMARWAEQYSRWQTVRKAIVMESMRQAQVPKLSMRKDPSARCSRVRLAPHRDVLTVCFEQLANTTAT